MARAGADPVGGGARAEESAHAAARRRRFFGICLALCVASGAGTIAQCAAMSAMGEAPMPGGWTMSTAWGPMCGQSWPGVAASFLGMWLAMTVAMMLPSLAPELWRYRQALERGGVAGADRLAATAGFGYFAVWIALGSVVFAAGAALAQSLLQQPALARLVPCAAAAVVLGAGLLQLSAWKARRLACCRRMPACGRAAGASAAAAWRHGLRLGLQCSRCCANLTAILLVAGVMDAPAMIVVTAAITAERLATDGTRAARRSGCVAVVAGAFLLARALGSA